MKCAKSLSRSGASYTELVGEKMNSDLLERLFSKYIFSIITKN